MTRTATQSEIATYAAEIVGQMSDYERATYDRDSWAYTADHMAGEQADGIDYDADALWDAVEAAVEAHAMNANNPTITAKITGRFTSSTVPDNETAVDAAIYADGVEVGEATLLADHTGGLAAWGSLDNWADDALRAWLDDGNDDLIDQVVAAVRAA